MPPNLDCSPCQFLSGCVAASGSLPLAGSATSRLKSSEPPGHQAKHQTNSTESRPDEKSLKSFRPTSNTIHGALDEALKLVLDFLVRFKIPTHLVGAAEVPFRILRRERKLDLCEIDRKLIDREHVTVAA